jgi:hypothetical protein
MWPAWFWSWTFAKENFGLWWWLWGPLNALTFHLWVIFKYSWLVPSYNSIKKTGIVLTSLDEALTWSESPLLLLVRVSVWDELQAHLPLPYIFVKNSINLLFTDVSLIRHHSESSSTMSCHHFTDLCDCVCISRGWRTPTSWIIPKIFTPVFKSFKPLRYAATT